MTRQTTHVAAVLVFSVLLGWPGQEPVSAIDEPALNTLDAIAQCSNHASGLRLAARLADTPTSYCEYCDCSEDACHNVCAKCQG